MDFPLYRPRRLRKNSAIRKMVRETELLPSNFIYPMFVAENINSAEEISSMPGVFRYPLSDIAKQAEEAYKLGIPAIILFGMPGKKDPTGAISLDHNGIIQNAIKEIKNKKSEIVVITDVCLCEYTDHGHCGVIENGDVNNDATIEVLAAQSLSHAKAGVDMVAPSDMMDGRVGAIREVLDDSGYENISIMAYSAKYCSAFYGPFRDAVDSAPQFGDRQTYQMDPANRREAIKEVELDIEEGADIVMVKPALSYLDIISQTRELTELPVAAYNVSGEYAMVKLAAANRLADEKRLTLEVLTSIKRAGADLILSYHAKDAAKWLG